MQRSGAGQRRRWRSEARAAPEVRRAFKALGKRIRILRQERKLTLEEVAPVARIDWKHLQIVEQGKTNTTVASLVGIAKALDVRLRDLFEDV